MRFDEALAYLLGLGHETLTAKLGLRNTESLLQALNNPQNNYQSIQIAGTNGKGSTAAILNAIVESAGIRSGLYTSPHLVSITERIKIAGHEIGCDDFARLATEVRVVSERLVEQETLPAVPTFFEQLTAIALIAFREAKVELAILETGLGGRLDATTCAQAQTVAITPIAMDHEEYLGETIEEIAAEKAAIIRPGVTAVVARQAPAAFRVILERCKVTNVTPIVDENHTSIEGVTKDGRFCVDLETPQSSYKRIWLGLRGRHQITNTAVAIMISETLRTNGFQIPRAAIIHGVASAENPGRLELLRGRPAILLDGSHNPLGAETLRDYLDEFAFGPLTLVFGGMRDKKLEEMAAVLFPAAEQVILVEVDNLRSAKIEALNELAAGKLDPGRVTTAKSAAEALAAAREKTPPQGLICITGSLYLIGEAKKILATEESDVFLSSGAAV